MNKRRKILAAMLAAFMLLVPMVSTAQIDIKGDGGETSDLSGTWGTMRITDNETEEYVPLGEGLWLLAGAAGLYLLVKSRKTRKATAVAAAALALTLGTTQCKKTEESVIPAGETISISFLAGNGAKSDIDVTTGRITWEKDDEVYVVCNNAFAPSKGNNAVLLGGNLKAQTENSQQSEISGEVIVPEGYTLPANPSFTFYYVGDGVNFDKTDFTFEISSQDGVNAGHYMVGRTGAVEMEKKGGKYGPVDPGAKHFDPLTSVLRLNTSEFGANQSLTMDGGNNLMTINLAGDATPSYTAGSITFTSGDDVQISVIPTTAPGENENVTLSFSGNGMDGSITVTNGIKAGRIYSKVTNNAGYPIHVDANGSGVLSGKFSVSATEYVQFSRGNLQATYHSSSSSYSWAFAANQYDIIGNAAGNTTINNDGSNNNDAVVDLFGWSSAETMNYGINISTQNSDYFGDFKDWGDLAIGGYEANTWHTLSKAEWDYLLNSRTDGLRAWKVLDGSHPGLVILPDGTNASVMSSISSTSDLATYNAVFLPAAGKRKGTTMEKVGEEGFYWPSTPNVDNTAYGVYFSSYGAETNTSDRYYGYAVRLVQKFEKPDIEPEFVDLGLPSGLLWANVNLGAKSEYDAGNYYVWGETEPWYQRISGTTLIMKTGYAGYTQDELTKSNMHGINAPLTGEYIGYDAAYAKSNGAYRMPTLDELRELWTNTNRTSLENKDGYYYFKLINKNDPTKYIIIPASGYCSGTSLISYGGQYNFWSSTEADREYNAYCIEGGFEGGYPTGDDHFHYVYRANGYPIRAVKDPTHKSMKTGDLY